MADHPRQSCQAACVAARVLRQWTESQQHEACAVGSSTFSRRRILAAGSIPACDTRQRPKPSEGINNNTAMEDIKDHSTEGYVFDAVDRCAWGISYYDARLLFDSEIQKQTIGRS